MRFNLQTSLHYVASAHTDFLPLKSMIGHRLEIEHILRTHSCSKDMREVQKAPGKVIRLLPFGAFVQVAPPSGGKAAQGLGMSGIMGFCHFRSCEMVVTKVCYTSERFGRVLSRNWRTRVRSTTFHVIPCPPIPNVVDIHCS